MTQQRKKTKKVECLEGNNTKVDFIEEKFNEEGDPRADKVQNNSEVDVIKGN